MQIIEYSENYRDQVINLWQACGLVMPWNDPNKDIDRKLKVDADLFLLGLVDGQVIGTVMGGYEGHRGWISYLSVSPNLQKQGYGRLLMQAVEEKIRRKGCPKINLQIRETNTAVIAFYRALGYEVDKVIGMGKRLESD